MRIGFGGMLAVLVCLAGAPSRAADQPGFTVDGQVRQTLHLNAADVQKLPVIELEVAFEAQGKMQKAKFKGALLLDILNKAEIVDAEGKGSAFRHAIEVASSDGYAINLAIGEFHPFLEGKQVLVAYERDGQALESMGGLRVVVPGDKHGARSIRDLVRITVK